MIALKHHADPLVERILDILNEEYVKAHPKARIDAYRFGTELIRIRIIDPDFAKKRFEDRGQAIWDILQSRLDLEAKNRISLLLALAPSEVRQSQANLEFERPTPLPD